MASSDPLVQNIQPGDCATAQQSPPDFRWPDVISSGGYTLTLSYPDGHTRALAATQNWLNWDEVLPAGWYSWTVSYSGGAASKSRTFIIDANSKPFVAPAVASVLSAVSAKAHPRSLPDATTLATMQSQRAGAVSALLSDVSGHIGNSLPSAGSSPDDAFTYSKLALASLEACVYSNQSTYCDDAVRRIANLASWDPSGPTSYTASGGDMAARYLTWTVALGYDWLYGRLTSTQRSAFLATVKARTAMMYNDIIGSRSRIAKYPRDSHGNQTLSYVGVISVLMAGDLSDASTWMNGALPLMLNATNPWGDDEGGFANASTQGNWDVGELLPLWYQLRVATGIDIAKKAWVINWARYFAYFTPPGMAGGTSVFGDGFEENESEHQARFGKGYTYFAPSALGRWQASLLNAEDPTRFEYLMAPPADFSGAQAFPAGTPNALALAGVGQVVMHSDLSNLARTSVYFKSSPPPFGAFNHSHADQNGFVVNAGGQRLAIESGYYDDYKTAHWLNWYHTTRSKNAITFDGGQGQSFYEDTTYQYKQGYGQLTAFSTSAAYDVVSGDATPAYNGALSKAKRSMVYLRPGLIMVYDDLASATARTWEWNIHALNQMSVASNSQISIQNNGQTMCVTMLAGPAMAFTQTNQFTANPTNSGWSPQWHGTFASTAKTTSTEFVALLNVGCSTVNASASKTNGVWSVAIGSNLITINAGVVAVNPSTQSPPPSPPPASGPTPYTGTPIAIPGTFEAEDFDKGGEGVAYHDLDLGNQGGQYRTSEDVDIIASSDSAGGGYVVNNFASGEWLLYTINVATAGSYNVQLRTSSKSSVAAFHVEVDGQPASGSIVQPNTGDWTVFQWGPAAKISLSAGKHTLKIVSDVQYFNLNTIQVTAAATQQASAAPYTGTPIGIPGAFQAENFDLGGEGVGYHDSTPGNQGGQYRTSEDVDIVASTDPSGGGYMITNFTAGEWLSYTINVKSGGKFNIQLRTSSTTASTAFHVEVDGVVVVASTALPNTGSANSFVWGPSPSLNLTSGKHVLKIFSDQQSFNLNLVNIVSAKKGALLAGTN